MAFYRVSRYRLYTEELLVEAKSAKEAKRKAENNEEFIEILEADPVISSEPLEVLEVSKVEN